MQYCRNCREFFDGQYSRREPLRLDDSYICPFCGEEDDIEAAQYCRSCGKPVAPDDISGGLCPACAAQARQEYINFWSGYSPAFRDYVIDVGYHPAG